MLSAIISFCLAIAVAQAAVINDGGYGGDFGMQGYGGEVYQTEYAAPGYGGDEGYGGDFGNGGASGYGGDFGHGGDSGYGGDFGNGGDTGYGGDFGHGGDSGYGADFGNGGDFGYGGDSGFGGDSGYGGDFGHGAEQDTYGPVQEGYGVEPVGYGKVYDGGWGQAEAQYQPAGYGVVEEDFSDFYAPKGKTYKKAAARDFDFDGVDFKQGFNPKAKSGGRFASTKRMPAISYNKGGDDYGYDVQKNSGANSYEHGHSDLKGNSLYGRKFIQDGGMYENGVIAGLGGENEVDKFEHVSKYRTGGKIDSYGEKKHKYGGFDAYGHHTRKGHNFLKRNLVLKGKVMSKGVLDSFGKAAAKGKMAQQSKFLKFSKKHKNSGPRQHFSKY